MTLLGVVAVGACLVVAAAMLFIAVREQGVQRAAHAARLRFAGDDVAAEHARLTGLGVMFTTPPTPMGPVTIAVLDDTCGNLIQLYQV